MLCDYVLCIRPKIKYLFCSILKLRETMCFRKENNGCYRSTITQNEKFTLYIMWFTIPEIKTPVPTNAGNEIQSCVGMLNFISWGVTYVYKNISQKAYFFFCVVIRFFHPRHNGFSIPDLIHYIYFPILILEKEPVFPFPMLSAKQRNYWYHFYNVFGMTRSLTGDWTRDLPRSKPALYH